MIEFSDEKVAAGFERYLKSGSGRSFARHFSDDAPAQDREVGDVPLRQVLNNQATMGSIATVYVPLLDEGIDVWRPVKAEHVEADLYQLTESPPDDEVWPFAAGDVVRCELRELGGDGGQRERVLVAYKKSS